MKLKWYREEIFSTSFTVDVIPDPALNNAPYFTENLIKRQTIKKTLEPQEWSYKLP